MLRIENGAYSVEDKKLIEDINLDFKEREFTVIMGQNGAGKSTLLKVLAGSEKASEGEVILDGKKLNEYSDLELAKKRAVLSQHYDVSFPISVEDITMMGRYPHFKNTPFPQDIEVCSKSLELMGIAGLKERDYNTLSGGEAQKVQMARVLSQIWHEKGNNEHKILFLDEPVSNLDIHYQHHILNIAKQYVRNNTTVIAVLHDINLAMAYADRIIFMKSGKIVKSYSTAEKIDKEIISEVFEIKLEMITNPYSSKPFFVTV